MNVTTIKSITATRELQKGFNSFQELADFLLLNQDDIQQKKDGELWSPCTFTKGRLEQDATEVSALVLDFDEEAPDLKLITSLNVEYFAHQTFSGGWRVALALDKPVPAYDWRRFWETATKALDFTSQDPSCKNASRFYFYPVKGKHFEYHKGRPLPTEEFLALPKEAPIEDTDRLRQILLKANNVRQLSAIRLALAGKPISHEGNRNNAVTSLGFYLGKLVVPEDYSVDSVLFLLSRGLALPGPEPKSEWEKHFRKSFTEGRAERTKRVESAKKALDLDNEWCAQLQLATNPMSGITKVVSNTYNANVILENEGTFAFRENLLEGTIEYRRGDTEFQPFGDVAATDVSNWLQEGYKITLTRNQVFEQAQAIAHKNYFDPIKEYLEGLKWDGVGRIKGFCKNYLNADDSHIHEAYGRRFLISMAARALRPGCKVDTVLTLKGPQGFKKSSTFRALAEPWFSDTKIVIGDKDSYALAASNWLHEFGELASLKRADLETTKGFFSAQEDYYRPVWARVHVRKPRRCTFAASTNDDTFLRDPTGNRRWWVVEVKSRIDIERIRADRDLLLAEAVHAFKNGEQWYLTDEEEELHHMHVQQFEEDDGSSNDAYIQAFVEWWKRTPVDKRPLVLTTSDVLDRAWQIPLERATKALQMRAGDCLRELGFDRVRAREGGKRYWRYTPPASWYQPTEVKKA